jgi:hypothetical protein
VQIGDSARVGHAGVGEQIDRFAPFELALASGWGRTQRDELVDAEPRLVAVNGRVSNCGQQAERPPRSE